MKLLSGFAEILCSVFTPVMLLLASVFLFRRVKTSHFFRTLKEAVGDSSALRALSLALAGTLGVGNITGVASALLMGGPGALFWMWSGAVIVMGVKYAEVNLAVRYRLPSGKGWIGGAMYYIRGGIGGRGAVIFSGLFAVFCCVNALITGTIVQSNAAAGMFDSQNRLLCGIILAVFTGLAIFYGAHRIAGITSVLIPPLTGCYILISLWIICSNHSLLTDIFKDIFFSAFTGRAAVGSLIGFGVREAFRYGLIRGIFSNEAGCGTSPTAHAAADAKSPHHQAVLGMVEVIFDTLILCTLTGLVLLIGNEKFGLIPWGSEETAASMTLEIFGCLCGKAVYGILQISVLLFAFSTVIAQYFYGVSALSYLSRRRLYRGCYGVMTVICVFAGALIDVPLMWLLADSIIGLMTAINCVVLIMLRRRIVPPEV